MSQKLTHVGLGLNIDDAIAFIHGVGLPGQEGGTPDDVSKGSLYVNDTDGRLWKKVSDGSGFVCWKELAPGVAPVGLNNFSGMQVIDSFKVDDAGIGKWVVEVTLSSDKTRKYVAEVTAIHNGTASADATNVNFNEFGIINLGTDIPGLVIDTSLSGTGTDQIVTLQISATENIDVVARRMTFGEGSSNTTTLDLSSVPHDVSSSILSTVSPNDPILFFAPSRAFKVPANFANSKAVAKTAGIVDTVFTIYKSLAPTYTDSAIGTLTFAAGSKTGTFSTSTEHTISSGDVLAVVAPAMPDAALKNISVTIQASYV